MSTDRLHPIFAVPEILEHILAYLGIGDLLALARRVSHSWESLIATSPAISKSIVDLLIANRLHVGNKKYENGQIRQFLGLTDFTDLVEPHREAWLRPDASWRRFSFAKGRDVFMLAGTTEGERQTGCRRWRAVKTSGTLGELYDVMVDYVCNSMQKKAADGCGIRWWVVSNNKAVYPTFGPNGKGMVKAEIKALMQTERRLLGNRGNTALLIMMDRNGLSDGSMHVKKCRFCTIPNWGSEKWVESFRGSTEHAHHHWQDVFTFALSRPLKVFEGPIV